MSLFTGHKITVIVPTRNQAPFLPVLLDSLRNQTFADWRCFLVNDGSTDSTAEILTQYALKDSRFHFITLPTFSKGNAQLARNLGLTRLETDYALFCDSDDIFPERALELLSIKIEKDPKWDFVYGQTEAFVKHPGDLRLVVNIQKQLHDLDRVLVGDMPFMVQTMLFRSRFLKRHGIQWTVSVRQLQDWDFLFTVLSYRPGYQAVDEITYYWRNDSRSQRISRKLGPDMLKNRLQLYVRWYSLLAARRRLNSSRIKFLYAEFKRIRKESLNEKIQMRVQISLLFLGFHQRFMAMKDNLSARRRTRDSVLMDHKVFNTTEERRNTLVRVSVYEWAVMLLKAKHEK